MTETSRGTKSVSGLVEAHVDQRVQWLRREYLPAASDGQPTSAGAAAMAELRRADPADITADPALWGTVMQDLPEQVVGESDEPSRAERAVHASVVLYAMHQQSRSDSMHRRGVSLGEATRQLALAVSDGRSLDMAVVKRFQLVATATIWSQRLYHLRTFVSLLRAHAIPLDYGRLARDLYLLQDSRHSSQVRLRWGRDLHRSPTKPAAESTEPTTA